MKQVWIKRFIGWKKYTVKEIFFEAALFDTVRQELVSTKARMCIVLEDDSVVYIPEPETKTIWVK